MSPRDKPRLLFVHAHPDDESLTTGGTIAHYAARGADVRVVTCTLGEEGDVLGERYTLLGADHADQLGGYRIGELTAALHALGVDGPVFLGGPGRWRDSGMPVIRRGQHPPFANAGPEAVEELVAIIDTMRPHVVVSYDPKGGYGH
ncbi:MAG: PIG-L family deacetylase, partial [Mycobacterium sp.]